VGPLRYNCSTSTFLTDVGLLTHTWYTTISPSSVPSIHHAHLSREISFIYIHLYMYHHCLLHTQRNTPPKHSIMKTFDTTSWLDPSLNLGSDTTVVITRGAWGTMYIRKKVTTQARETPHFNPKP